MNAQMPAGVKKNQNTFINSSHHPVIFGLLLIFCQIEALPIPMDLCNPVLRNSRMMNDCLCSRPLCPCPQYRFYLCFLGGNSNDDNFIHRKKSSAIWAVVFFYLSGELLINKFISKKAYISTRDADTLFTVQRSRQLGMSVRV